MLSGLQNSRAAGLTTSADSGLVFTATMMGRVGRYFLSIRGLTDRRSGAWPAGGLLGGKDPAGRFALSVVNSVMDDFAACFARSARPMRERAQLPVPKPTGQAFQPPLPPPISAGVGFNSIWIDLRWSAAPGTTQCVLETRVTPRAEDCFRNPRRSGRCRAGGRSRYPPIPGLQAPGGATHFTRPLASRRFSLARMAARSFLTRACLPRIMRLAAVILVS
jgi:hypothetical protein